MTESEVCECELPVWLAYWFCGYCDNLIPSEPCECFDIINATERFRTDHPDHKSGRAEGEA